MHLKFFLLVWCLSSASLLCGEALYFDGRSSQGQENTIRYSLSNEEVKVGAHCLILPPVQVTVGIAQLFFDNTATFLFSAAANSLFRTTGYPLERAIFSASAHPVLINAP